MVVTNSYGATTSAVATLTVFPPGQASSVTNGLVVYLNFDNNINAQAGTTNNGSLYTGGRDLRPALPHRHHRFSRDLCQHPHRRPAG